MDNKYLREQFAAQIQAAKDAEIYENMFIGYGTLLGYVRNRGIIQHDNDMDVCFLPHNIDVEQYKHFVRRLDELGCYEYRRKYHENPITHVPFWTSIRMHPSDRCWKCCHWFQFEYKGYYWHHKGQDTKVKGIPKKYLELGPYINFLGQKVRIPKNSGACLDFWYPDWLTPRKGGNSYGIPMIVKNWKEKSTWIINNS